MSSSPKFREYRIRLEVENEEPVGPLGLMYGARITPTSLGLRWIRFDDDWKLMVARVEGLVHRKDDTVGVRTSYVDCADPYSSTGWWPTAPEWVKLAAQRFHPKEGL